MQSFLVTLARPLPFYNIRSLYMAFGTSSPVMTRKIRLTEEEQKLRQLLLDVSDYIAGQGCAKPELRFTGGWVRDKLLGITSKDIDIGISSMTGYRFGTLMKQYLEKSTGFAKYGQDVVSGLAKIAANPEKSKHLETVTTRIMGLDIDLVNLRRETYVEDSRNPTMEFGTAEEDALRRDSTVNALFYNLSTAEVEDLTSKGLNDMDLKIIRTPLSPYQTFKDDPLRVLRCIRFASKLGYSIDIEAERSMSDTCIKEALRAKITRERVGLEIDKMLKGPQPHTALSLVDRLGLYDIIFTDPNTKAALEIDTRNWKRAYNQLFELLEESNVRSPKLRHMQAVRELLLFNPEQEYLAWLLCSLTPWARIGNPKTQKPGTKRLPPMAAVVAREGLKLENKSLNVVRDSVLHLDEIIASKDALSSEFEPASVPTKRKRGPLTRDQLGMCIRRWGSQWRSSVLFALLVQCMETDHEHERSKVIEQYANWLTLIKEQDLLEAYSLKPILDGKRLQKELEKKPGPWMVTALKMAMEWQLRNPKETQPDGAIEEVLAKYKDLEVD